MRIRTIGQRRSGTTLVESAIVLGLFLMFLMGIFEYGRYLMMIHVSTNAARGGVRYATVNVDKPDDFDTTPITISGITYLSINDYTKSQMGGVQDMMIGCTVTVFPVDASQMYSDPPVIAAKSSYTSWKQATFTERIAVQITGTYKPILPVFVFFYASDGTIPISITACSGSEG